VLSKANKLVRLLVNIKLFDIKMHSATINIIVFMCPDSNFLYGTAYSLILHLQLVRSQLVSGNIRFQNQVPIITPLSVAPPTQCLSRFLRASSIGVTTQQTVPVLNSLSH